MCGIAGYFERNGAAAPDEALLASMEQSMRSRGPDDRGIMVDPPLGLAHSRLAVMDPSPAAHQPFRSPDGRYALIYNGEIFNTAELRGELPKDHAFRSSSDTEILLEALIHFGAEKVLPKLNGFFAFAFWDGLERTLFLARDRFGVKPLFYHVTKKHFAFASSLNALKVLPFFDPSDIREDALLDFLGIQYVPKEKTFYTHTFRLLPGHCLRFSLKDDSFEIGRWYEPHFLTANDLSYADARAHLRELVTDAVVRRLEADVPLGTFLSGGLDSAIVASIAAKHSNLPMHACTIAFADPKYDESEAAKDCAAFIRSRTGNELPHSIRTVSPCDFEFLRTLSHSFGEPFADSSMLPFARLCEFARTKMTVALSGDGADELFYGYERYRAMRLMRTASFLPCSLLAKMIPVGQGENDRLQKARLRRFLQTAAKHGAGVQYESLMTHDAMKKIEGILQEDRKTLLPYRGIFGAYPSVSGIDPADAAARFDFSSYLPGDILTKADVCSMAFSLEVRSPFLDHRVVDFARSLHADFKLYGATRKRILADAFAKEIPPDWALHPKKGFGVPVADWMRNEWKEYVTAYLTGPSSRLPEDWFCPVGVQQ